MSDNKEKLSDEQLKNLTKRWEDYLSTSKSTKYYAIQRIDLLIIAISSFGILFCLNVVKFFIEQSITPCCGVINTLSIISFLCAITINFSSQLTGYHANRNAEERALQKLRSLNNEKSFEEDKFNDAKKNLEIYNFLTNAFNLISTIAMFIGMILSGIFYMINF